LRTRGEAPVLQPLDVRAVLHKHLNVGNRELPDNLA
jgi:hypothetical protein